jgi:hypothetical protein
MREIVIKLNDVKATMTTLGFTWRKNPILDHSVNRRITHTKMFGSLCGSKKDIVTHQNSFLFNPNQN